MTEFNALTSISWVAVAPLVLPFRVSEGPLCLGLIATSDFLLYCTLPLMALYGGSASSPCAGLPRGSPSGPCPHPRAQRGGRRRCPLPVPIRQRVGEAGGRQVPGPHVQAVPGGVGGEAVQRHPRQRGQGRLPGAQRLHPGVPLAGHPGRPHVCSQGSCLQRTAHGLWQAGMVQRPCVQPWVDATWVLPLTVRATS